MSNNPWSEGSAREAEEPVLEYSDVPRLPQDIRSVMLSGIFVLLVIFWNWMWGIPGALLAVPMLAVFKIVCDRVRPLATVGHFIGG